MATKIHMEALSPTMEEGQIVKWHKAEGDEVSNGDVLADIETDKATMELVARGEGILRKILMDEGATAPVGHVIGVIGEEDEDISDLVEEGGGAGAAAGGEAPEGDEPAPEATMEKAREKQAGEATATAPAGGDADGAAAPARGEADEAAAEGEDGAATAGEDEAGRSAAEAGDEGDAGRVKASPVARKLADEAGVDLASVKGSGPGGRVVKRDVEQAAEGAAAAAATGPEATAFGEPGEEYEEVPVSQMRKTIARRLTESLGPVPHFFLTVEADMERAMQARASINAMLEEKGEKVSVNDLLIRVTGAALARHPEVNAQWHGDHVRRYRRVHIGVAVAVEDGLITPVIRDAHLKGVAAIGREVREMAGRAREKKLKPEEYTGATFSISNLGMFGIQEFTAVINPPEAGILAVGRVEEIPVVMEGQVVVRPRMKITMSCDHRVIDGAMGARFLQTLKAMLEEPAAALS